MHLVHFFLYIESEGPHLVSKFLQNCIALIFWVAYVCKKKQQIPEYTDESDKDRFGTVAAATMWEYKMSKIIDFCLAAFF